jgi:uncharacterized lipoprotein YddW (UPF0748 family)
MNHLLGLSSGPDRSDFTWSAAPDSAVEVRGLWVVRDALTSEQEVRDVVAAACDNGFNALFVQVRGRGETYYRSTIDPIARPLVLEAETKPPEEEEKPVIDLRLNPPEEVASVRAGPKMTFDPLELLVDLAHVYGIKVHAWVNVFLTWSEENPHPSDKHVINRHPEWITADSDGVRLDLLSSDQLKARWIEGLYLCPARPEVREYIVDVAREIATNYRVDGVHLDYVRYPGRGTGIDEYSRSLFAEEHGFDPIDILPEVGGSVIPVDNFWAKDLAALWQAWRAGQITDLVTRLSDEVRSCRPGIVLTAAVRPDPGTAERDYGQEWAAWLRDGHMDFVAPMLYSASTPTFFEAVNRIRETLPDHLEKRVWAGIALYKQGPRRASEKIDVARAAGLGGFVLFSYNSVMNWRSGEYLPAMRPKIVNEEKPDRTALGEE